MSNNRINEINDTYRRAHVNEASKIEALVSVKGGIGLDALWATVTGKNIGQQRLNIREFKPGDDTGLRKGEELEAFPMCDSRLVRLDRIDTLAAAHRLIEALAETTPSRSQLEECRNVMAKLEKIVEGT